MYVQAQDYTPSMLSISVPHLLYEIRDEGEVEGHLSWGFFIAHE